MDLIVKAWHAIPDMLKVFGSVALLFFACERLWPKRRGQPVLRAGVYADILYVPIHYLMRVAVSFLLADALTDVGRHLLPGGRGILAGLPVPAQAAMVLLVLDLFFYFMHRLKHRWHWWWRLHETHHSSANLDFLASVRFHPLEKVIDRLVFLLPLTVFGASEGALLIWSSVDVFFGMLNHANVRFRLGPLAYLFVGPEMHRWHHARDPARRDVNFGNNLSIFDWMFGTAALAPDDPVEFGIDDQDVYPSDDILRQWMFAFRPAAASTAVPATRRADVTGERVAAEARFR